MDSHNPHWHSWPRPTGDHPGIHHHHPHPHPHIHPPQYCLVWAVQLESPARVTVVRSLQIILAYAVQVIIIIINNIQQTMVVRPGSAV